MPLGVLKLLKDKKKPVVLTLGLCLAVLILAPLVFVLREATRDLPRIPAFREVQASYRMSESILLDRHGQVLHQIRVDPGGRRLDWIPLSDISPVLPEAVVHAEDREFYSHRGVDWRSLAAGGVSSALRGNTRGASTLTMQLVGLLPVDTSTAVRPFSSTGRRSISQKIQQIRMARALERTWSKEQILEAYLNLVSFRGELQGIAAASLGLFDKKPHGVDSYEAAVLACLLRGPNAPASKVSERARFLAARLNWGNDPAVWDEKIRRAFSGSYSVRPQASFALHAANRLLRGTRQSVSVRSTLDKRLQLFAQETLAGHLQELRDQNVEDGSILVVDNPTGEILAYVGNSGRRSSARFVDGTQALRQAGSILKPLLYGLAFDSRVLTPASLLDDSPLDLSVGGGNYRPRNYDDQFHGLVTARTALASSLNIPAVRTLQLVGVEGLWTVLDRLKFRRLEKPEFYGPSLALGSADVCLEDLVNAYRTLANQGLFSECRLSAAVENTRPPARVFTPEAAFLVSSILSDRESRALTFGLENPLGTRFWSAAKTGTSKDMRDNWCVGYSDRFTVGVWVGNFSGKSMWNVSGVSGAAPVWMEIMNYLHRDLPSVPRKPPKTLISREIPIAGAAPVQEWFIPGTEPIEVQAIQQRAGDRILYPSPGTIMAIDPDIPSDLQVVLFEASSARPGLRWVLNGKPVGGDGPVVRWNPSTGKYRVELRDDREQRLDVVDFEVRGPASASPGDAEKVISRETESFQ